MQVVYCKIDILGRVHKGNVKFSSQDANGMYKVVAIEHGDKIYDTMVGVDKLVDKADYDKYKALDKAEEALTEAQKLVTRLRNEVQ